MSRILIIPDIHGRTFWKESCQNIDEYDKVVFLGDYLDPYPYEGISYEEAMYNFLEIIKFKRDNFDKVILLQGNHDAVYTNSAFKEEGMGSRYDYLHANTIAQIFYTNYDIFQVAYEIEINNKQYFFSHAGVLKPWFDKHEDLLGKELNTECFNNLPLHHWGIFGEVSRLRGGSHQYGGIMWADCNEHNNVSSQFENVYQIFGHTQQEEDPVITEAYACLDCRKAFILNDDGTIIE